MADSAGVKVLLVGTGAHPIPPMGYGAVERILFEYAHALEGAGHSAHILNEVYAGSSIPEYRFALRLPSLVRREQYDVLHASTPVVANRLAGAGLPFVYTSHSRHWFWKQTWRHRWGAWLERRAVRRAAGVVALTEAVAAAMRSTLPSGFAVPISVIPYGLEAAGWAPAWEQRTGRRALGVGVVLPLKRWELAAAALKGTGVRLRIAGPVSDAVYAAQVRAAGDDVEFLGEVDQARLRQLYAESDLLLHPSVVEVLPRSVLEAMASSLPVIGSSVIGSMFPGGRGGFASPPGASPAELIHFLRTNAQRLVADAALRRQVGEAGREVVVQNYSWDQIVAKHLELYQQLAGPPR